MADLDDMDDSALPLTDNEDNGKTYEEYTACAASSPARSETLEYHGNEEDMDEENIGEDNMGVEAEVLSSESILAALRQLRHDYEQLLREKRDMEEYCEDVERENFEKDKQVASLRADKEEMFTQLKQLKRDAKQIVELEEMLRIERDTAAELRRQAASPSPSESTGNGNNKEEATDDSGFVSPQDESAASSAQSEPNWMMQETIETLEKESHKLQLELTSTNADIHERDLLIERLHAELQNTQDELDQEKSFSLELRDQMDEMQSSYTQKISALENDLKVLESESKNKGKLQTSLEDELSTGTKLSLGVPDDLKSLIYTEDVLGKPNDRSTPTKVIASARFDFEARDKSKELSISRGEELTVMRGKSNESWWLVRNTQGKQGFVPLGYLKFADETLEAKARSSRMLAKKRQAAVKESVIGSNLKSPSRKGLVVIARYEYNPNNEKELGFSKGEKLMVSNPVADKHWWMAENHVGKQGFVPTNFLKFRASAAQQFFGTAWKGGRPDKDTQGYTTAAGKVPGGASQNVRKMVWSPNRVLRGVNSLAASVTERTKGWFGRQKPSVIKPPEAPAEQSSSNTSEDESSQEESEDGEENT
eukprot:m.14883 g.14883  ORF g.14883 m.14883 type:complete len:595 (+) comp5238_c0_seq1:365-2149(+)